MYESIMYDWQISCYTEKLNSIQSKRIDVLTSMHVLFCPVNLGSPVVVEDMLPFLTWITISSANGKVASVLQKAKSMCAVESEIMPFLTMRVLLSCGMEHKSSSCRIMFNNHI